MLGLVGVKENRNYYSDTDTHALNNRYCNRKKLRRYNRVHMQKKLKHCKQRNCLSDNDGQYGNDDDDDDSGCFDNKNNSHQRQPQQQRKYHRHRHHSSSFVRPQQQQPHETTTVVRTDSDADDEIEVETATNHSSSTRSNNNQYTSINIERHIPISDSQQQQQFSSNENLPSSSINKVKNFMKHVMNSSSSSLSTTPQQHQTSDNRNKIQIATTTTNCSSSDDPDIVLKNASPSILSAMTPPTTRFQQDNNKQNIPSSSHQHQSKQQHEKIQTEISNVYNSFDKQVYMIQQKFEELHARVLEMCVLYESISVFYKRVYQIISIISAIISALISLLSTSVYSFSQQTQQQHYSNNNNQIQKENDDNTTTNTTPGNNNNNMSGGSAIILTILILGVIGSCLSAAGAVGKWNHESLTASDVAKEYKSLAEKIQLIMLQIYLSRLTLKNDSDIRNSIELCIGSSDMDDQDALSSASSNYQPLQKFIDTCFAEYNICVQRKQAIDLNAPIYHSSKIDKNFNKKK